MDKTIKPKRCKSCREFFTPFRPLQIACSHGCAISLATAKREKEAAKDALESRMAHRAAVVKAKPRSYWMKQAQTAFNAYIRARDKGMACISCGSYTGKKNAGHYRSVGSAPELRFEPLNCHLQCEKCNSYLSGNLIKYRIRLVCIIGIDALRWLEGPHEPAKYTIPDLQAIRAEYLAKAKALK